MIGIPLILAIFFSMLTVVTRREKVRVHRSDRFITFTLSLLILVGGTWPLWHNNGEAAIVSDKLKYFYNTWSPPEAYRYNGFIISFISYMKKVQMIRPAGYSKEKIR